MTASTTSAAFLSSHFDHFFMSTCETSSFFSASPSMRETTMGNEKATPLRIISSRLKQGPSLGQLVPD